MVSHRQPATVMPDLNQIKGLFDQVDRQTVRIERLLLIALNTTDKEILPALKTLIQLEIEELKRQSDALADLLRSGAKETV